MCPGRWGLAQPSPATRVDRLSTTPIRLPHMNPLPTQYARTEDGVNIAYWEVGSGPTLIHSPWVLGNIAQEWEIPPIRAWYEHLAQHYRLERLPPRRPG